MTVALTLAGTLEFNPMKDSLKCPDGSDLKLAEPFGDGLPVRGFDPGEDTFQVGKIDRMCALIFLMMSNYISLI